MPATVNRCLALVRGVLRMAHFDWQWIDSIPKVRLLTGEVERDRWLLREEADRLLRPALLIWPPSSALRSLRAAELRDYRLGMESSRPSAGNRMD